jgi:Putative DNA-binding domain
MALTYVHLTDIREDHLQQLIAAQAAESLHIEYKRETYAGNDDQRREFLADISSFANASGGDLIIGMTAAKGVPTELYPFMADGDAERLRLEQMARDGLHPRITNLQTFAVPLSQGGCVIVVRVPKSYNPPHRVIFKNSGRFWARSSAGKYEPNVEELRRIFIEAPVLAERIRAFRIDQLTKIAAGNTPVVLAGNCLLVLHIVPYSSVNLSTPLSIAELETKWSLFPPLGRPQATHRYVNFDGFVVLSSGNPTTARHHSYAQVFRSGIVEAVSTIERSDGDVMALTMISIVW